ncbi:hypothetical protein LAUMK35_03694 [Mycobacterium pseudokansasii]|nr:hypothetical protein LAUMK35_03694 [Mycobacterium pseudokansasii]VAZ98926.1 hypothetical protein LAUMK21_03691 [Mycobacterium pseudokansasii]
MCELLGVARLPFYKWRANRDAGPTSSQQGCAELDAKVAGSHTASDGVYGAPDILADLRADGEQVSRKTLAGLLCTGTRPRSSTTMTASSWSTTSNKAIRPMPQPAPAATRVAKSAERTPRTVTVDRCYGDKAVDNTPHGLGVRNVVIPHKGKPSTARRAENTETRSAATSMVNRQRRPHQQPHTRLRLGPHEHRRHRRRPDLDSIRRPGPQPGQEQGPSDRPPTALTTPKLAQRSPVPNAGRAVATSG